jgi:antirestriction protein ArdC
MRRDIYAEIITAIVEQLEHGVRPWQQPWSAAHKHSNRVLLFDELRLDSFPDVSGS